MTVLIAGAGIAGLTLGLSLHQVGIPFHIYEAVEDIRPLGVGINLQSLATRELFELGLEDALDEVGLRTREVGYFTAQGQEIWREPRGTFAGNTWPQYSIHRGGLQMALLEALIERAGPDVLTMGAAVTGWRDVDSGVEVTLTNRKTDTVIGTAIGDVLIAADGINSVLRAGFYPDEGPAVWGGTMMWRGVTRGPKFLTGRSMAMVGNKACKFVCYPIGDTDDGGSLINWIADLELPADYDWLSQDWNRTDNRADFAHRFDSWSFDWIDIPKIIAKADGIWEFPMVDRNPLPQWSFGPVTLLGDAAHAMYPIGSNGASQGIIDARVLARELRDHGVGQGALQSYDDIRSKAVNAVVLANRGDGPDKILDIVAERAPDGFDDIETVMPLSERQAFADRYKAVTGMTIEELNKRPAIIAV
ncbi:flavin-dependent oxidoreductase [Profundibacter sp.]|uniref:flavin-dependent oxidoreductase n=1 Tax=Profundibacter sp. TaxID=3101071 RepID=UPI003D14B8FB